MIILMQRLSQLSSHLLQGSNSSGIARFTDAPTPLQADRGNPANINTTMAKTKVVVTRKLIDVAQQLLDEKKVELEIVQWDSEKVRVYSLKSAIIDAFRSAM